jgi:SET domain-containing protein
VRIVIILPLIVVSSALSRGTANNNKQHSHNNHLHRPLLSLTSYAHVSAVEAGIRIGETKHKGLGAFTLHPIAAGAVVGEYKGEILTLSQVKARYWNEQKKKTADRRWIKSRKKRNQGTSGDYLFDMSDDLYIDGEDADLSSWCRFMNHATCGTMACNVETRHCTQQAEILLENNNEKTIIHKEPRLWFVAIRDIEVGEELSYDYGDFYWD